MYNFHGNNKYLGKVRFNDNRNDIEKPIELKTNYRVIGDVDIDFNTLTNQNNNEYTKLNDFIFNIYAISSLSRELKQYIINKDYLSIIRLVNDLTYSNKYFKDYINIDSAEKTSINLSGDYIQEIYNDIITDSNILEHAENEEEKQMSFENKIDEIRKKKNSRIC